MTKFSESLKDILIEKNKTFKDLAKDGIIANRTFYHYDCYTPFLPTILKIANYLKVSLDYLTNRISYNNFKVYSLNQTNFYKNLMDNLKDQNISQNKFAKDLKIGRANFTYWKHGKLPKLESLILIADYLNINIDDLLDFE